MPHQKAVFEDNVQRGSADACWPWLGNVGNHGYGRFGPNRRSAHRVAWEKAHGQIHDSLCVLHRCDNRVCVNPGHLFLGTREDNASDRDAKGRLPVREHHPSAKLTWHQVRQARELRREGWSWSRLAARFGVEFSTIRRAVLGMTWKCQSQGPEVTLPKT